jgi:hypothetical protein
LSLRKQLTEVLEKLSALNIEKGRYDDNPKQYAGNFRNVLSDQRGFFVRQADFIVQQIDEVVSSLECRLIAHGFDAIDDVDRAADYFQKAITKANDFVDTILSKREYARFEFKRDSDESNKIFKEIFDKYRLNKSCDQRLVYYIAFTYEFWAKLYDKGTEQYIEKIQFAIRAREMHDNEKIKENEIKRLKDMLM